MLTFLSASCERFSGTRTDKQRPLVIGLEGLSAFTCSAAIRATSAISKATDVSFVCKLRSRRTGGRNLSSDSQLFDLIASFPFRVGFQTQASETITVGVFGNAVANRRRRSTRENCRSCNIASGKSFGRLLGLVGMKLLE